MFVLSWRNKDYTLYTKSLKTKENIKQKKYTDLRIQGKFKCIISCVFTPKIENKHTVPKQKKNEFSKCII